jgi:hypothetical protein
VEVYLVGKRCNGSLLRRESNNLVHTGREYHGVDILVCYFNTPDNHTPGRGSAGIVLTLKDTMHLDGGIALVCI